MSVHNVARRGNTVLEAAMFIPIIVLLTVGMEQIGKITYTYYTLRKTLYTAARYVGTQQGVNFCDAGDPAITAAKYVALTGTTDNTAPSFITDLTADMIQVQVERYDPDSATLGVCECSTSGCDASAGGGPPDFVVVSIPDGYPVTPRIPFLTLDPIPLKPFVKVPFGGT